VPTVFRLRSGGGLCGPGSRLGIPPGQNPRGRTGAGLARALTAVPWRQRDQSPQAGGGATGRRAQLDRSDLCLGQHPDLQPLGFVWDSTDGAGFLAALRLGAGRRVKTVVVVGTGGAARAVAAALLEEGAEVLVLGRNLVAGTALASELAETGSGMITSGETGTRRWRRPSRVPSSW